MQREFTIHTATLDEVPVSVEFTGTPARPARLSLSRDYSRDEAPEAATVRVLAWTVDNRIAPDLAAEVEMLRSSDTNAIAEIEDAIHEYLADHISGFLAAERGWAIAA